MAWSAKACLAALAATAFLACAQTAAPPAAFTEQLRTATEEANQGNISAAEADVKAAIQLAPEQAGGWYELGVVLGQAADFPGAEAALRRAIQLQPDLAKAHLNLALTLIAKPQNKQDWPGAIAECREALKYHPDYPEALDLLGAGLVNTGQIDEAVTTLRHCLELTPSLAEAHFNLALALTGKDQLPEAEKEYKSALTLQLDYPEAASQLGKLLLQMGNATEAEQELNAALRLNPDLADAHYTLARVLRSLHRAQDAEVEFAEAKDLIDRPPNGVQASNLSNQALQLAAKGDMQGAIATLHKAIVLKPDYGVPHYNLGLILADSGELPGAVQEITKAISLDPAQPRMWFDLGRVLRRADDPRAAAEALSWAARLSPADPAIAGEIASLRASQPQDGALVPALRQYRVRVAADTAADHLAYATELSARGDFEGAVGELLRALTLKPGMFDARRGLATAYARLGQNDRAELEDYKLLRCEPGNPGILAALRQADKALKAH